MKRLALAALTSIVGLGACPSDRPRQPVQPERVPWSAAENVDWALPPPIATPPRVVPPVPSDTTLPNGVRVIVVRREGLPVVAISALHLRAGSREDGARAGVAALTADLLDEGAGTRDRDALADEMERIGARLDIDIATDYATTRMVGISDRLDASLALLADVVRRPRFTDADVARVKADRLAELAQVPDRPRTVAAQIFDRVAFGTHPYAQPAAGSAATLGVLATADVRAFYDRAYLPQATVIVIAGNVDPAFARGAVARTFGDWRTTAVPAAAPISAAYTPALAYVDVPGATSTAVIVGRPERDLPSADAELANAILGGWPEARLDRELRVKLHAATGAGASWWTGAWGGTWTLATSTKTELTVEAIRAMLALVAEQRTKPVPAAELDTARTLLARNVDAAFETATAATRSIARLVVHGQRLEYYAKRGDELAAATPESVRAAIAQAWDAPSIVVVGDWAKLRDGLSALGLPVVHYDATGRRL